LRCMCFMCVGAENVRRMLASARRGRAHCLLSEIFEGSTYLHFVYLDCVGAENVRRMLATARRGRAYAHVQRLQCGAIL